MDSPDLNQPTSEQIIDSLKNEVASLQKQLADEKQATGVREAASAAKPQSPQYVPSSALQAVSRDKAIAAVGGYARWHLLPLDARLKALGERPASGEEIELARKLFGRNADSAEAARLARINGAQYARLRVIHTEQK